MALEFIKPAYSAVKSINGETGAVEITAEKLGAATVDYVEKRVTDIQLGEGISLEKYATKEYVNALIVLAPESGMMKNYYTKDETDLKIKRATEDIDLTNYCTKEDVGAMVQLLPETFYTKEKADERTGQLFVEYAEEVLPETYYSKEEVDEAIENIELTPGPQGEPGKDGYSPVKGVDYFDGEDGEDYVLTEEDLVEIAALVDVSGFQTAEQVSAAITEALNAIGIAEEGEY